MTLDFLQCNQDAQESRRRVHEKRDDKAEFAGPPALDRETLTTEGNRRAGLRMAKHKGSLQVASSLCPTRACIRTSSPVSLGTKAHRPGIVGNIEAFQNYTKQNKNRMGNRHVFRTAGTGSQWHFSWDTVQNEEGQFSG